MVKYRKNAGIVVFNKDKKVLMCDRIDFETSAWQFPQGGINEGETPTEAAKRELEEETGITSVRFVSSIDKPIRYHFPEHVCKKLNKKGYNNLGQEQYWSLFYFFGNDDEIVFDKTEEIEFKGFEWVDINEAPMRAVEFKRDAYQKMVDIFAPIIEGF